jgi:hypothetical protein
MRAGERRHRQQPRHAQHEPRTADGENRAHDRGGRKEPVVAVWGKVEREQETPHRPGREAEDAKVSPRSDEEQHEPRPSDRPRRTREL